jgi:hypothetical protein
MRLSNARADRLRTSVGSLESQSSGICSLAAIYHVRVLVERLVDSAESVKGGQDRKVGVRIVRTKFVLVRDAVEARQDKGGRLCLAWPPFPLSPDGIAWGNVGVGFLARPHHLIMTVGKAVCHIPAWIIVTVIMQFRDYRSPQSDAG